MKTTIRLSLGKTERPWNPVELSLTIDDKTTPRIGALFVGQGRGLLLAITYQHKLAPRDLWHVNVQVSESFGTFDWGTGVTQGHQHKELAEAIDCVKGNLDFLVKYGMIGKYDIIPFDAKTVQEIEDKCIDAALKVDGLDCSINKTE
jgi:hypothetical protein